MLAPMTPEGAHRAARTVGVTTAVIGAALVTAPRRLGPLVGLTGPRGARAVGLVDLALVPGLVAGTPRWPWMAARAAANVATAAYGVGVARRGGHLRRVVPIALGLLVATAADTRAVAALRRAR